MHTTKKVQCRIWILALRITMIGLPCVLPLWLAVSHTVGRVWGTCWGAFAFGAMFFFTLQANTSCQDVWQQDDALRCLLGVLQVMASVLSGEAICRTQFMNDWKCLGITVAKVSEVLSLFILVVYRTAEPACGHPPSFGGFPNDGHPSHSTILVLKQIETNGDLGIPHFQKVPNYHIHRYSWMAFPQSQRIDKCIRMGYLKWYINV